MKRILFYLFTLLSSCQLMAQTTFTTNNSDGIPLDYEVVNTNPRQVKFTGLTTLSPSYSGTELTIPATTSDGTNAYQVVEIGRNALSNENRFQKVNLPEGLKKIKGAAFRGLDVESLTIPSSLEEVEGTQTFSSLTLKYIYGLENTKVTVIPTSCFASAYNLEYVKFPSQLQVIGDYCLMQTNLTSIEIPPTVKIIGIHAFMMTNITEFDVPESVEEIGWGAFTSNNLNKIKMHRALPPMATREFVYNTPNLHIYVPIDATVAYEAATYWADLKGKYREEVKIGASGYSTLYLANENFIVPTGCEAFVIENITKSTTPGQQDQANAKKFAAGTIIPAGQAVILKGTAGQTYEYQANATGTEAVITDNMLIGTATDQTINAAGYDYYLFGNGPEGQGFYRQTGHGLNSISLKAHKAGLRVPKSTSGSAKSFVVDFDSATDGTPTGIETIATRRPSSDGAIYDLQGRRVIRPAKGVYIMNGKKIVFN